MKKLQDKQFIESSDISLCSALRCLDYRIEKIVKTNTGRAIFWIEKDEKIEGAIQKFFNHELKVDALSYFNFLKEIKTQIYNVD